MPVRPLLWVAGVLCFILAIAPAFAADNPTSDPLVRVLQSKGILSQAEADSIATASPADQRTRLAQILLDKGLISATDYQAVSASAPTTSYLSGGNGGAVYQPASSSSEAYDPGFDPAQAAASSAPKAPPVIPAVAPVRVLQTEPTKPGGMIPDIKLGSGAKMKIYGFFKSSAQYDTNMPTGNDAPLPMFGISAADTSPVTHEFHLKARASRIGANFEWPDIREGTTITARLEADWEGNFTRAFNRNVSAIRSNQFNLRLAWMRLDHAFSDNTSAFALFGQDWTPFGSSILPNSLETTLLGVGFGSMYERDMQFRIGFLHNFGGFKFGPEFAIVYPGYGDTPPFINTQYVNITAANCAALPCNVPVTTYAGNLGDQLAFGERQGADSGRPEVQGRLVFQWQLDHAKGVAPAQIIFSGMQGARSVNIVKSAVPLCTAPATSTFADNAAIPLCGNGAGGVNPDLFRAAFPTGASVDTDRNGWTAGFQLPTRWVTFVSNYYRGTDLRFYFAGQLLKEFANLTQPGLTGTLGPAANSPTVQPTGCPAGFNCAPSINGESVIAFGVLDPGATAPATTVPTAVIVPQGVVRSQGGFAELGFPLSRIFQADPLGRNAGWTMNLHYGLDSVFARDAARVGQTQPRQSSWGFANVQYKMNQYVTFGYEAGYYATLSDRTCYTFGAGQPCTKSSQVGPFWQGIPQHQVHDLHSEFATIFTF